MGTNTHAAFSLLKTSLSVDFRKRLTGIDDIIPDQHYRRSALLQTEPDGFLREHAELQGTRPLRSPYPRRSVSMYYTNGRPEHEIFVPDKDARAHSMLWQKVSCAMQADDALTPKCI